MSRFLPKGSGGAPGPDGMPDEAAELDQADAEEYYDDEYDGDYEHDYVDDYEEPQPPTHRRRGSALKNTLAILISLAVLVGGGYFAYTKISEQWAKWTVGAEDYPGPGVDPITVEIPMGATLTDMANILYEADVVASPQAFLNAAQEVSGASNIQSGSYRLLTQMAAKDVVAALLDRGNMVINQLTIPEGLRNTLVLERIEAGTGIPIADLEAALADPAALGVPAWSNGASEGYLFPETYSFDDNPTAVEILSQMGNHFNQVATELDFVAKAEAQGLSPHDAVTLASIIEKETRDPIYGPDIAQVLYNRLRQGMKLQLDSTVIYAVNSPGTVTTTDEERANQSPYNTYVHEGLPPGAISNPGRNSLTSAVNPTTGDYLYFVATNPLTGETKFAATWQQHEANVAEFQQWCRDNPQHCTGG